MPTQSNPGRVRINQVGKKRLAPGNTEIVHSGEFRHKGGVIPDIKRVSKYDHGEGPKEFTHMNKSVAKTGTSQHPGRVYLAKNGTKRGA